MPITKAYRLPVSACLTGCASMWREYKCWKGELVISLVSMVLLSSGIKAHRDGSGIYWW